MSSDWISAFDNLAAGGVIDFDAPAFLMDQPARYVGNPSMQSLAMAPTLLPDGTKMKTNPISDEFNGSEKNLINNPSWKKWLFGGSIASVIAGVAYGILAKKGKLPASFKNLFSLEKFKALKDKIKLPKVDSENFKKIPEKISNFFKKIFSKKTPVTPPPTP